MAAGVWGAGRAQARGRVGWRSRERRGAGPCAAGPRGKAGARRGAGARRAWAEVTAARREQCAAGRDDGVGETGQQCLLVPKPTVARRCTEAVYCAAAEFLIFLQNLGWCPRPYTCRLSQRPAPALPHVWQVFAAALPPPTPGVPRHHRLGRAQRFAGSFAEGAARVTARLLGFFPTLRASVLVRSSAGTPDYYSTITTTPPGRRRPACSQVKAYHLQATASCRRGRVTSSVTVSLHGVKVANDANGVPAAARVSSHAGIRRWVQVNADPGCLPTLKDPQTKSGCPSRGRTPRLLPRGAHLYFQRC